MLIKVKVKNEIHFLGSHFVAVRIHWLKSFSCLVTRLLRTFRLESVVRNVVQSNHRLVWILHDQIFAVLLFHAQIDDAPEDAPGIVHA